MPKGYEGFLILAFDMPGGLIPDKVDNYVDTPSKWPAKVEIDFDEQGIARFGYSSLPGDYSLDTVIERETGLRLPLASLKKQLGNPLPHRAALRSYGTGAAGPHRRELKVEVFLVGDPAKFPENLLGYRTDEVNRLLRKHFGVPLAEIPTLGNKK